MQFYQVLAILSIAAGSTLAAPQLNNELSKRTCWELTGTALSVCQEACTVACVGPLPLLEEEKRTQSN